MSDLPRPGLGTSGNDEHEQCAESVRTALEMGYRHVDTAQMYNNEAGVGEGIATADVDREKVFVATKIHPDNLAPEDVRETARESLDRLGLEYVDLLYVHWPISEYDAEATLSALDELHAKGLIENVGVSNFTPELLDEARKLLDTPLTAHQVEMHPLLPQEELVAYADDHDHDLVAYCPLGQGKILDHPVLTEVADKHDATPAQVSLAWLMEKGSVVPIPKATGEQHLTENYEARRLALDEVDVTKIDRIDERRRLVDPDAAAWNQ